MLRWVCEQTVKEKVCERKRVRRVCDLRGWRKQSYEGENVEKNDFLGADLMDKLK